MPDVYEVLSKLPPTCATWDGNKGYIIKRGVQGMEESLLATENDVQAYNAKHGVTPDQKQAMECGCVMGWDSEAANLTGSEDNTYRYAATVTFLIDVTAGCEADAARVASANVTKMVEDMNYNLDYLAGFVSATFDGSDLDLVE